MNTDPSHERGDVEATNDLENSNNTPQRWPISFYNPTLKRVNCVVEDINTLAHFTRVSKLGHKN